MSTMKSVLLAAAVFVVGAGAVAHAQLDTMFDLSQLPEVKGTVAQYLPTPRGDVDGLLLTDGTEVHVPPPLSTQLVFAVKPGDAVTIHGLKARAVKLVDGASITNDATHVTISWGGPVRLHADTPMDVSGTAKAALYGPRGEVNGVLLDSGVVIHLPPPEATRLADMLAVGKPVTARGEGYAGPLGKSLDARQIGPDAGHMVAVAAPRMMGGPGGWHEHMERMMHGMDGDGPMQMPVPPPPPPAQ